MRFVLMVVCVFCFVGTTQAQTLRAGFGEADITPKTDGKTPVYIAGFGQNRKAVGVLDPLMARVVVLADGKTKIALVSVDLVGLFYEETLKIRKELAEFDYVLVSSTHNHEGPDTIGIWGPNPFLSGVDPNYLNFVRKQIVRAVKAADKQSQSVTAKIGVTKAPELLHDSRKPIVKHDDLVAVSFHKKNAKQPVGLLVQWNCHPETLGGGNKKLSADYVCETVRHLKQTYKCPVVYLTGTVGGLMTSLHVPVKSKAGKELKDGTYEKTLRYGRLVGEAAEKALAKSKPITLSPIKVRARKIYLPVANKVYLLAFSLGVLKRQAYLWRGKVEVAKRLDKLPKPKTPICMQTELAILDLGDLSAACIPGEIYPELVLNKVQTPVDPGADFMKAKIEPAIYNQMRGKYKMLIGLANDELGYILPKRQWDEKAPFCYGRKRSQYGEINSLGPETGPLLCEAFRKLARDEK